MPRFRLDRMFYLVPVGLVLILVLWWMGWV